MIAGPFWTVLDSAGQRGRGAMEAITDYDIDKVTVTDCGKILNLLMMVVMLLDSHNLLIVIVAGNPGVF
jgi:hypothetical protein